jgi:hypothetical protein
MIKLHAKRFLAGLLPPLLTVWIGIVDAKDLPLNAGTKITGKLSLNKEGMIFITSGDTVRGEKVNRIPIDMSHSGPRYEELKRIAVAGKATTIECAFSVDRSWEKKYGTSLFIHLFK